MISSRKGDGDIGNANSVSFPNKIYVSMKTQPLPFTPPAKFVLDQQLGDNLPILNGSHSLGSSMNGSKKE